MKNFKKYVHIIRTLLKAKQKEQSNILKAADPELIKLITETVYNILKGNVPMPKAQLQKLHPYKRTLLQIAKRPNDLKFARTTLVKKRGRALLKILLPTLLSIGANFING